MPNATISATKIAATVQAYPQGDIAYITFLADFALNDDTVDVQDILDAAYGGSSVVTGKLIAAFDRGGDALRLTGGGAYLSPYVDTSTGNILFRRTDTGALAADAAATVTGVTMTAVIKLGA